MTRTLYSFFYIISALLLASCAAKYETYYVFDNIESKDIKQCVNYCENSKERCLLKCRPEGDLCKNNNNISAKSTNSDYLNSNADKELAFDPIQCHEMSCDCDRDYRACYQLCGGSVKTKKRCIANCPDEPI